MESGNLNLLEPSEPVQTCNGIALPQLLTQYCAGDQIEKNEMGGVLARIWESIDAYRVFGGEV
jgi:hypothetical protein